MATVIITERLVKDVLNNVELLRSKELEALLATPDHWPDLLYNGLFSKELLDTMKAIPETYFQKPSMLTFNFYSYSERYVCNYKSSVIVPYVFDVIENGITRSGTYNGNVSLNPEDARWGRLLSEYRERSEKKKQILEEIDSQKNRVEALLTQFSSLGPVLKAWPALWELLDESMKVRHKTPAERKKQKQLELPFLDDLTAKVTLNRMRKDE